MDHEVKRPFRIKNQCLEEGGDSTGGQAGTAGPTGVKHCLKGLHHSSPPTPQAPQAVLKGGILRKSGLFEGKPVCTLPHSWPQDSLSGFPSPCFLALGLL